MSPDITISPSEGEMQFTPRRVQLSKEALTNLAPAIALSDIGQRGELIVSQQASKESMKLAQALFEIARDL